MGRWGTNTTTIHIHVPVLVYVRYLTVCHRYVKLALLLWTGGVGTTTTASHENGLVRPVF